MKASQSRSTYRRDFDVSLPLFSRAHPTRGPPFEATETPPAAEATREVTTRARSARHLLVFKGE